MIVDGTARLAIYSETMTAARITEVLGIVPTEAHEREELTRAGIAGRPLRPERLTYQQSYWRLETPVAAIDSSDQTGFASVRALVDAVKHRADELRSLRAACQTIIWWHGSSDSSQGGFVMPAELLSDLSALGCDLYGTAYLESPDEAE